MRSEPGSVLPMVVLSVKTVFSYCAGKMESVMAGLASTVADLSILCNGLASRLPEGRRSITQASGTEVSPLTASVASRSIIECTAPYAGDRKQGLRIKASLP